MLEYKLQVLLLILQCLINSAIGIPAAEALRQGLTDLKSICTHILTTFDEVVTPEHDQ